MRWILTHTYCRNPIFKIRNEIFDGDEEEVRALLLDKVAEDRNYYEKIFYLINGTTLPEDIITDDVGLVAYADYSVCTTIHKATPIDKVGRANLGERNEDESFFP